MDRIREAAVLINTKNAITFSETHLTDEDAWSKVLDVLLNRPGEFDSNAQLQSLLKDPVSPPSIALLCWSLSSHNSTHFEYYLSSWNGWLVDA